MCGRMSFIAALAMGMGRYHGRMQGTTKDVPIEPVPASVVEKRIAMAEEKRAVRKAKRLANAKKQSNA